MLQRAGPVCQDAAVVRPFAFLAAIALCLANAARADEKLSDAPLVEIPPAGPREEPYYGGPVPPGAKLVEERHALVGVGAVVLGIPYLLSFTIGAMVTYVNLLVLLAGAPMLWEFPLLMVPVIGPFLGYLASGAQHQNKVILLVDGSIQAVGAAVALIGLELSTAKLLYEPPRPSGPSAPPSVHLIPGAPGSPLGATLSLSF